MSVCTDFARTHTHFPPPISTQVVSLGADVHAVNEGGNKPLHVAAYEGHVAVMEALIERGT